MNLSSWSWAIEESDLKKQCDNYNTLKITESYRGISVLIMSAFMTLGLIFSLFTSFVTLSNVIIEMIIYVPLCFFIYRGHRWAIILLMLIWTCSQGFQLNEVIQSGSGNKFMPIIWWLIVMPYFWKALKVENERKRILRLQKDSQPASLQDEKKLKNNSNLFKTFIKVIAGIVAFILFILIILYNIGNDSDAINDQVILSPSLQKEIAESVVSIFCPSTKSDEEHGGGSGTIITEDGLILTNSHIIPQDEEHLQVDEFGCMVILPNPETGLPNGVYLAHPIIIPELSDKYDLAYLQIYAPFHDEEDQKDLGVYPRIFPTFDDTERCRDENVQLGESVRIFGYPDISGGYSLTITDGIVSNFTGDWLIMTSAKVSSGNSGGLAVDKYGCMLGVPSSVSSDETESLGIIIPVHLITKFHDQVSEYVKNL